MAPLVELDHVSKAYQQKVAVRDLSLRIEPGTMLGCWGQTGRGRHRAWHDGGNYRPGLRLATCSDARLRARN